MKNKRWTYEYTDQDGNRFYRLWDRQNKHLTVLQLRHYKDDLLNCDHVNWEIWKSPSNCENESYAEDNLEYFDCGIYGVEFIDCLTDAIRPEFSRKAEYPYKLCKEPEGSYFTA